MQRSPIWLILFYNHNSFKGSSLSCEKVFWVISTNQKLLLKSHFWAQDPLDPVLYRMYSKRNLTPFLRSCFCIYYRSYTFSLVSYKVVHLLFQEKQCKNINRLVWARLDCLGKPSHKLWTYFSTCDKSMK